KCRQLIKLAAGPHLTSLYWLATESGLKPPRKSCQLTELAGLSSLRRAHYSKIFVLLLTCACGKADFAWYK
ncbi:MAG: hypothetical protein LBQ83_05925, partial [Candidatus Margulisbacteria bacterium]|nr:hypothetical protein [Candidatus Margulisiibacteriota bacterium]